MKTYVYVDAFNLYYGCLRKTPYKWLDLAKLCQILLPRDEILAIKYYTAPISARPNDLDKPVRQQTYLRALRTISNLTIYEGHFLSHVVSMRLANPPPGGPYTAEVIKTEEKGSDVNLATHLLHDAHLKRYETAVIVSNDSDLAEPMRIVRHELGLQVGVLNPHPRPSVTLIEIVHFWKKIRGRVLKKCLFPDILSDKDGTFHKPPSW